MSVDGIDFMKPDPSLETNDAGSILSAPFSSPLDAESDFDSLLEWVRLYIARIRKNRHWMEKYRLNLRARNENETRLLELDRWRQSSAFTAREKAALSLGESVSRMETEELSREIYREVRRHFNPGELMHLTAETVAVNDRLNLHCTLPVRVLVVEDNPWDQDLLRHQLEKTKMANHVVFVSHAVKAIELLAGTEGKLFRQNLIAIFLDLHLPEMNGVELLQHIRTMPGMEEFPVIVMTSSNDPRDLEKCERLKVMSYVNKPVTFNSFSKAVADIFHQSDAG